MMLNKMKYLSLLILALAGTEVRAEKSVFDYDSIWKCDQAKRNWYCDDEEKKSTPAQRPEQKPVAVPQQLPQLKDLSKIKTAEELRQELKVREDIAVMAPTEQNIKNYLDAWHMTMDKGTVFADQWRRVVWKNPEYDYSLKNPVNSTAVRTNNQAKDQDRTNYMREIAKEHGLIFFFRSDCPYCHQYAPTLKMLSEMYGIEILGVSIDGGGLPDFPNPRDGRAVAQKWGIEKVPATFIASKKTGEHAPVGFGVMSLQEVIERIWTLTNTQPGQDF
ncbi:MULTISPECIES: conjugal transfer protein TraF [Acinetobacter]|uniref:conjugal transfer protein TraF n=1 Tax=Acinetobacter TaxID=469 RepID=UPI0009A9B724|nr:MULTISPECIES: conjugal transfer protein TraF [Acinetobacter]EKT9248059.1 conjugal transfer protein TraF [Acinetobacter baumannii]EKV8039654.1 conjugal transfer protein TraF [Acinetobacter baumannii]MBE2308809.1 conjugal transfer protein TraF [Acinetobacter baumannii]MBE2623443.1 conjugal transfer protein TraF [Acinetobacter baumannii]MBE2653617.1 conjugal transfer protein TraF [Acinetobacter baumannii]